MTTCAGFTRSTISTWLYIRMAIEWQRFCTGRPPPAATESIYTKMTTYQPLQNNAKWISFVFWHGLIELPHFQRAPFRCARKSFLAASSHSRSRGGAEDRCLITTETITYKFLAALACTEYLWRVAHHEETTINIPRWTLVERGLPISAS